MYLDNDTSFPKGQKPEFSTMGNSNFLGTHDSTEYQGYENSPNTEDVSDDCTECTVAGVAAPATLAPMGGQTIRTMKISSDDDEYSFLKNDSRSNSYFEDFNVGVPSGMNALANTTGRQLGMTNIHPHDADDVQSDENLQNEYMEVDMDNGLNIIDRSVESGNSPTIDAPLPQRGTMGLLFLLESDNTLMPDDIL